MKKLGFTLAEVMVALALIGVITSLTIPTFVSSNKNKTNSAKLSTTISVLENAFTSMIAAEAAQDLTETRFGREQSAANLGRYLKISNSGVIGVDYYTSDSPFNDISGNSAENLFETPEIVFEVKNGALVMFEPSNIVKADAVDAGGGIDSAIGYITIDVNGSAVPNIWGRDAFYFLLGTDGLLYPAGGLDFSLLVKGEDAHTWNKDGSNYICSDDGNKNMGCTARLLENNYEVDY